MDATFPPPLPAATLAGELPVVTTRPTALRLLLRLARGLKSWLLAALSCLSIPFAIVFSGWTYRLVQRRALSLWARNLDHQPPSDRILPRWIASEDFRNDLAAARSASPLDWIRGLSRALFRSLALNLRAGFLVVLNSMLLTLPGGFIMLFSWYTGWNNSFHKGYEQAAVGPLWGFAGIFLFMAAMTYVPIAQARQAVTGSAKAFWNYRKVRDIIHRRPLACLLLTGGYTTLGFGIMVAINALMTIGNADAFAEMSNAEAIAYLHRYFFWWAVLFVVPGFVILKLFAGRIYAGAAFDGVTQGGWSKDDLCGAESEALAAAPVAPSPPPLPGLMRTGLLAFSLLGRLTLRVATFLLLLAFAFELYVAQFFNFGSATTWLRQPMVQIPWFHEIPAHLRE